MPLPVYQNHTMLTFCFTWKCLIWSKREIGSFAFESPSHGTLWPLKPGIPSLQLPSNPSLKRLRKTLTHLIPSCKTLCNIVKASSTQIILYFIIIIIIQHCKISSDPTLSDSVSPFPLSCQMFFVCEIELNLRICEGTIVPKQYIQIWEQHISNQIFFRGRPCLRQRDNAKSYSAQIATAWLSHKIVRMINWSTCTDLSSIQDHLVH